MTVNISPETEARLLATARAEGMSVDALVETLIDEREEFAAITERATAHMGPFSREQAHEKIDRGFFQYERGEIVDGDTFAAGLLTELDEIERKRRAG